MEFSKGFHSGRMEVTVSIKHYNLLGYRMLSVRKKFYKSMLQNVEPLFRLVNLVCVAQVLMPPCHDFLLLKCWWDKLATVFVSRFFLRAVLILVRLAALI